MIVILNAPPGAGKDTIGDILRDWYGYEIHSFKKPMFDIARALLGQENYNKFLELYNDRGTKEEATPICGGFSPRNFFIHISENMCKPVFGEQYFGKRFLEQVGEDVTVITDGGFPLEVYPLVEAGHKVVIARLHRKGYDFLGDSRNYLREGDFEHMPKLTQPSFIDIELIDGYPREAAHAIEKKIRG